MKNRLWVLSLVAVLGPASVASAAVSAEELAVARLAQAGFVQVSIMAPLRVSAASIVTHMVRPQFPAEMRRAGLPGYVRLELAVDDRGRVQQAAVLESSGDEFSREALRSVTQWQFATVENPQDERRRIVRVPIHFDLLAAPRWEK